MRYALIENNTVQNIIVYDGEQELDTNNMLLVSVENLTVNINDKYINGEFIPQELTINDE